MEFIACTGAGKVIGRYKASDIEMTDDVKPANSHSALANVGDDFKVVRDNMLFRQVPKPELILSLMPVHSVPYKNAGKYVCW